MSTVVSWKGDGLSNQTFTATSVGTGDTPAPTPSGGTALTVAAPTISPIVRGPVLRIAQVGGAGAFTRWDYTAAPQQGGRVYWGSPAASIATNHPIIRGADGAAQVAVINVTDTGRVNLYDSTGALRKQSATGLITAGTRYRFAWRIDATADTAEVRVYIGEATTPIITLTDASLGNYGTQLSRIQLGNYLTTPTSEVMEFDDLVVTNTYALPGGVVTPSPPAAHVTALEAVIIDATTSTPGSGGTLSYAITQTGGATTAPIAIGGAGSGVWRINRHPTDTLTYDVTVTESGGAGTSVVPVSVDPVTAVGGDAVEYLLRAGGAWT